MHLEVANPTPKISNFDFRNYYVLLNPKAKPFKVIFVVNYMAKIMRLQLFTSKHELDQT